MPFNLHSLKTRMILLLSLGAILIGVATTYGFFTLSHVLNAYDHAISVQFRNEREALLLQSDFKKQVQEWKNVLLRGHQSDSMSKYWGRFEALEKQISERAHKLAKSLQNPQAQRLIQAFIEDHQALRSTYRNGLAQFKATGFDPKAGDMAVKGIDRPPTNRLIEAAKLIAADAQDKTQTLKADGESAMVWSLILSGITTAMVAIAMLLIIQQTVVRPTRQLSTCLQRFASGDFTPVTIEPRNDEFGDLATSASELRPQMGNLISQVHSSISELSDSASQLSQATRESGEGMQRQQAKTAQVAQAMDQMAVSVQQVATSAVNAAEAARQANSAVDEGRNVVEKSIQCISGLASEVESASAVIHRLETDAGNIGSVLDVIKGIAEQTNLLALNAAIEAARAGEQGRGFAVVADEVRTLAGRTQESTSEIQAMIEQLQNGTSEAVRVMEESRERAEQSVDQAARTGESLTAIADSVHSITEMNNQIATSAEQQSIATNEIHQHISSINQVAEQSARIAQETARSGAGLAGVAQRLETLTTNFRT